ncbi:hypothetical protein CDL12_08232 [Handroanthus impetiginosus]|nr:hypothetical protein CDL12_08232 [Handroanthus impetiginosus]
MVHPDVGVGASVYMDKTNDLVPSNKDEKTRGFDLDLNVEDTISSINNDPFYPFKNYNHVKTGDDSECGSSIGPLRDMDSMRVSEGLKQTKFMSNPHGALPMPIHKTRGRKKNNNDVLKKKIELAKKEQVDRFARVAAPSGLLGGLNPGIINHVRNSKQVHSIIEALVRSKKTENREQGNKSKSCMEECTENMHCLEVNRFGPSCGDVLQESNYLNSEVPRGADDSYTGETRIFERMHSYCNVEDKKDELELKLSSCVTVASENTSCLSSEESGNFTSVTSLSLKAANVASHWLELLNQDIKGRLAALRRSKKRLRAVISTELPLLISREFASILEKDSDTTDNSSADAHAVRWSTLFEQMDKALCEEESHLENWLNQVKEAQSHCERGLYNSLYNVSQETCPMGNNRLGEEHNSEKDLAVRAAAASIYSTCNYLLTMENRPCR